MKIIDFDCKGNMVRFYLGKEDDEKYHGDDWNDTPYECNAGTVYSEYVVGTADIVFPYDALVLEPCSGVFNSRYCKDDMKAGIVPCIIVVPGEFAKNSYNSEFDYWASCKGILKFYLNDRMDPTVDPALYCFNPQDQQFRKQEYGSFIVQHASASETAEGGNMKEVPIWQKTTLTIEEAAAYSGIGLNKISELTKMRNCDFVLYIGKRRLIKRKQFESFLEKQICL